MTKYFSTHERVILVFISIVASRSEVNTTIILEWAQKQFVTRVHTLFFFLIPHNGSMDDDKNNDLYTPGPCFTRSVFVLLMMSQSIVDDVIISRQMWRDHVNSDISLVRYRFHSRRYSRPIVWQFHILSFSFPFDMNYEWFKHSRRTGAKSWPTCLSLMTNPLSYHASLCYKNYLLSKKWFLSMPIYYFLMKWAVVCLITIVLNVLCSKGA